MSCRFHWRATQGSGKSTPFAGWYRKCRERPSIMKLSLIHISSEALQETITEALERFNPDAPLEMLFDYVRIRFPTLDVKHVDEDILRLKLSYMLHEDYGFYSYAEHYCLGDIFVLVSPKEEKGVLLDLKGRGCRQFESYLLAQERSWYEFFMVCLVEGGVMKRLDLAINDKTGILNIPRLTEKCRNEECVSVFRSFKSYRSGELVRDVYKRQLLERPLPSVCRLHTGKQKNNFL